MSAKQETSGQIPSRFEGDSPTKLYRLTEAAEALDVHVNTIKRWLRDGKITVRRTPGGSPVMTRQDIDDLVAKMRAKTDGKR
jgi:excisionase family DNA binding protein